MNFRINKRRKNNSKKQNSSKDILLPSLNQKIQTNNQLKPPTYPADNKQNPLTNFQKMSIIKNNQFKKTEKRIAKQNIIFKNHKPYSGNPSFKINNGVIDLKIPAKSKIPNSYERDILTANPSLIGNKASFENYNENNPNLRYKVNGIINEASFKENIKENLNLRYQYYQEKGRKLYKNKGFGISKSSPRISSIKIISNPFENQKQKELNDYSNKIKVLFSYGDVNNLNKKNNMMKVKQISKMNSDSKNLKDNSNSLNKDKNPPFSFPNLIGTNIIPKSDAQNMLIKAVGKLNSQIIKKHQNLKSANLNGQFNDNYIKNKIGNKLIKTISKKSLNNSLKDSRINNSSIKISDDKKPLKPKSKCFISYAYIDYPNLEHRQEMEDYHCIKQALGKRNNLSYFAIFDGHGGKEVASFLSLNLHHYLVEEINNIKFGENDEENINNILDSIKTSFIKIDQDILENINFTTDVGSTATLIFIYYNNSNDNSLYNDNINIKDIERTLICANVGDSSGYLLAKSDIIKITKPHKCEDTSEVQRIRDKGGIVFQGRIFGKLILTRTLGDKEMKKYGVLPIPDFFTKKIENDDLFIIIASDGIWDVINEKELLKMGNEKELSSEIFSKKIMELAKERDTRDNSSCIVIKLNKNI